MLESDINRGNHIALYINFCKKHNFKPFTVTITLVFALVLLSSLGVWSVKATSAVRSRTVDFGLRNIGQLATQVAYYTNVQVISSNREIFGVTVPFTQSNYIYSYNKS